MNTNLEHPYDREEMFLGGIAGILDEIPDTRYNRKELYLAAISEHVDGMEGDISELQTKVRAMATDMKYKGSVEDYEHLPTTATKGDVYTTLSNGKEYVFDGEVWVEISVGVLTAGENITISNNEISADVPELLGSTGQSTTAGMTQKAITDALASAGGAKVLTAADYNYPVDDPTSVALWKLTPGIYYRDNSSTSVKISKISNLGNDVAIVGTKETTYGNVSILKLSYRNNSSGGQGILTEYGVKKTDDAAWDGYQNYKNDINAEIVDSLTSDDNSRPLSANQGKVLKDLIDSLIIKGAGAPTTSTVGTVGMLYEDTTNGDLYQCTSVSGSTYTWEEVGGGGGASWGSITGTLSDQTDLQSALDDKQGTLTAGTGISIVDNVISATGGGGDGIKVLTSADYNWNSTTQSATEPYDSVAFWRLTPGIYTKNDSNVTVYYFKSGATMPNGQVAILNGSGSFGREIFIPEYALSNIGGSDTYKYGRVIIVSKNSGTSSVDFDVHNSINNLTTTSSGAPLDAHQGKVLNDKIVALEARIAALEGNA